MRIMLCVLFMLGASVAFSKKPPASTTCDKDCVVHAQEHYASCMGNGGDEKRCSWIAHQAYIECRHWCM